MCAVAQSVRACLVVAAMIAAAAAAHPQPPVWPETFHSASPRFKYRTLTSKRSPPRE